MLTISKPLSASQSQTYHREEFANGRDNYYTEQERICGEWQGTLAEEFGLSGAVSEEHFARLSEGQHPMTGEQLVQYQTPRVYTNDKGETIRTVEHRAGWDATFSAPKSVSLTALAGGDERIRLAHREAVRIALNETEKYVQARIGGNSPAQTTGKWAVAKFEHDSSRPVDGYSAPQLHTHAVIFNITETPDGIAHALQPREIFRSQRFATAVYRAELAVRLRELGYEIERGEHGSPEIKGYTKEYLEASSPRRKQIQNHLEKYGVHSLEAAEIAAHQTRDKKLNLSRDQVIAQHKAMAEIHGNQADKVVAQRAEMPVQVSASTEASIKEDLRVSMNRNMEREAVADERTILTDALRHGMGKIRAHEARHGMDLCVTEGQFLQMARTETDVSAKYTTPEMKALEMDILQQWQEGVGKFYPLASQETQRATLAEHGQLNDGQKNVVQNILASQDRIFGLEGTAGTGKTTALKAVCEAAKREGYELQGLAPTSRAAINLESAEINTKTIARHLSEARDSAKQAKRFYVVDESSMIGTRQMHELINSLQAQDRVLFVGDTRQHEAVEAGRPYWQLRQAGMHTAELTEILRQKDSGLKAAVECLAKGDVGNAVEMMKEQGRIHEFPDRQARIAAIATEYAARPDGTLVISPDNASRLEISSAIRSELQRQGHVEQNGYNATILVQRQEMTNEDRRWARNYEAGDVLRFVKSNKALGISARERVIVCSVDAESNRVTVERANGRLVTYDPARAFGVTVYKSEERDLAQGDRIQLTAAYHPGRVANRALGTIASIDASRNLRLKMDAGGELQFNIRQNPHIDYGYAVTSHSSQGETADRVLIHVESDQSHGLLLNDRMAYVSVSRARFDAQIFTNDANSLASVLSRDVTHSVALPEIESKIASAGEIAEKAAGKNLEMRY